MENYKIAIVAAMCWAAYKAYAQFSTLSPTSTDGMTYNEASVKAIEMRLDESRRMYEISVVCVIALWGLIIAKKDETKLTFNQPQEIVMFIGSSILLLISISWHVLFSEAMVEAYRTAVPTIKAAYPSIPNVFIKEYASTFNLQAWLVASAIVCSAVTLVSANRAAAA